MMSQSGSGIHIAKAFNVSLAKRELKVAFPTIYKRVANLDVSLLIIAKPIRPF